MFPQVVPRSPTSLLWTWVALFSVVTITPASATITLDCNRPVKPDFDHSQPPNLEAVIESNEILKQYGVEAQAYVKCLKNKLLEEKEDVLVTIKDFREVNTKFREAYINK